MRYLCLVSLLLIGCGGSNQDEAPITTIDGIANRFIDQRQYVGLAIAAKHRHQMVFQQAWGYSDYVNKKTFTTDEMLALGSNAKTLTAAGILLLEDSNQLKLSDKLSKHLPYDLNFANNVTLNDLLCHTSGIPDVYGGGIFENYYWQGAKSHKELVDKLNQSISPVNPGIRYQYNNTGYFLLGLVLEHLSHQSLGDFYREHIFRPLKLQNAYYLADAFYAPKLTPAWQIEDGDVKVYTDPVEYRIVAGAGALGGDIQSYIHLFQGMISGEVLTKSAKNKMQSPCTFSNGKIVLNKQNQQIGLGIEMFETDNQRIFTRGGALNGHVSAIYHFEDSDLTLGIVGNTFLPLAGVLHNIVEQGLHHPFLEN